MNTIQLLEGKYSKEEAKEMLLGMLSYKINFLKLKNLSSEIRYEKPDFEAFEQIADLNEAKRYINSLLDKAMPENVQLKIETSIQLVYEDDVLSKIQRSKTEMN